MSYIRLIAVYPKRSRWGVKKGKPVGYLVKSGSDQRVTKPVLFDAMRDCDVTPNCLTSFDKGSRVGEAVRRRLGD